MQSLASERRVETLGEASAKVAAVLAERREELANVEQTLKRERSMREEEIAEHRAELETVSARLEASERSVARLE